MKKAVLLILITGIISFAFGQSNKCNDWKLQFQYDTKSLDQSAGCETDGLYFYVTKWNGNIIWKIDMTGKLIDSFSISGVSGLRDLAYDGTYFYGGSSGNSIYKMDFNASTPVLISTISCSAVTVRNICYDANADGKKGAFWVGNWATDLFLVSRTGTVLDTILASNHGLSSTYGSAFDNISKGGPNIWMLSANSSNPTTITQINVSSGKPTGASHNCEKDICSTGDLGGGLWIHPNIKSGTTTIGGLIQGEAVFGYDLATTIPDSIDLTIENIGTPITNRVGDSIQIQATIINKGLKQAKSFTLNYSIDNGTVFSQIFNSPGFSNNQYTAIHSKKWTSSNIGSYKLKVWVSDVNGNNADTNSCNDTKSINIKYISKYAFYENWEGSNPLDGWTWIDHDNDGKQWGYNQYIMSYSYDTYNKVPLTPDNYIITPPLTPRAGDSISYLVRTASASKPAEHYAVIVSTKGVDRNDFTDTIYQQTLTSNDINWQYKSFDLSKYAGDTIYIAFEHFKSTNNYAIHLDDIIGPIPHRGYQIKRSAYMLNQGDSVLYRGSYYKKDIDVVDTVITSNLPFDTIYSTH